MTFRQTARDECSYANVDNVRVCHMDLDWMLEFPTNLLMGSVTYTATVVSATDVIVLDTRGLNVRLVELLGLGPDGTNVEAVYSVGEDTEPLGAPLTIKLPPAVGVGELKFRISYMTSPNSTALCWMPPEQTDSGTLPFLFSQCQAIHARSMLPCQDTPGVRSTYSAKVSAPKDFVVVMSALSKGTEVVGDTMVSSFEQPKALASYLIAIAAGNLVRTEFSPRCAVYCEPPRQPVVRDDFVEVEKYVGIAESLVGPYEWGRYDVLVLPQSFPYGGMENPCLTFVSPTVLTGDRTQMDVIAHEVAHSWTGNLVGIRTWEDFWLNESFTMMLERKIMMRLRGEKYFDMTSIQGWEHLRGDVDRYGHDHPFTALRPNLKGVDPDDSFSSVPYEKGFNMLCDIQRRVGTVPFERWLHDYVQTFKDKSIDSFQFMEHIQGAFPDGQIADVDFVKWFDAPGMPPVIPGFDSTLLDVVQDKVNEWTATGFATCRKTDADGWLPAQYVHMVALLSKVDPPLTSAALDVLEREFKFTSSPQSEILSPWLSMCIRAGWTGHQECLRSFARVGRMKYARPLYRVLKTTDAAGARELFTTLKSKYHNIAQKMIARDLDL
eukprot:PhM_4_TR6491/c0_g1_i1/m.61602/K01254/LTA4H; leukotriene-A4 hydrolase